MIICFACKQAQFDGACSFVHGAAVCGSCSSELYTDYCRRQSSGKTLDELLAVHHVGTEVALMLRDIRLQLEAGNDLAHDENASAFRAQLSRLLVRITKDVEA